VSDLDCALDGVNPFGLERLDVVQCHLLWHVGVLAVCYCRRSIHLARPSSSLCQRVGLVCCVVDKPMTSAKKT
ncbi:hypothetical protein CH063_16012, partial [Colletotrichum higginsianum]